MVELAAKVQNQAVITLEASLPPKSIATCMSFFVGLAVSKSAVESKLVATAKLKTILAAKSSMMVIFVPQRFWDPFSEKRIRLPCFRRLHVHLRRRDS